MKKVKKKNQQNGSQGSWTGLNRTIQRQHGTGIDEKPQML